MLDEASASLVSMLVLAWVAVSDCASLLLASDRLPGALRLGGPNPPPTSGEVWSPAPGSTWASAGTEELSDGRSARLEQEPVLAACSV